MSVLVSVSLSVMVCVEIGFLYIYILFHFFKNNRDVDLHVTVKRNFEEVLVWDVHT